MKKLKRVCGLLFLMLVMVPGACGGDKAKTEKEKERADLEKLGSGNGKLALILREDQSRQDCKTMCERSFKKCMVELLGTADKWDQAKIASIKNAETLKKVQNVGYAACIKDCKRNKGLGPNAVKIRKCLKKKKCEDYANCIHEAAK